MPAQTVSHPVDDALRAYALGKLESRAAAAVARHLAVCASCQSRLAALTEESYVPETTSGSVGSGTAAQSRPTTNSGGGTSPLGGLPNYRIERRLGEGGMGEVFLAHNLLMDRPEVLKLIHKDLIDRPGAVERFLQEVRNAARLQHPNIVAAYSCLQSKETLILAMEYVPGQNLAEVVRSTGPLPVAHACHYIRQAALGLQHAHEKRTVHRDIKPHNLMLARDGDKHIVKVLDFGLAKVTSEKPRPGGLTSEGRMMGTPDYIAPEQTIDAARADIRADIYSLGCTLYFLLTGRPPFAGLSLYEVLKAHHDTEATPVNVLRPAVPAGLAALVARMMAKAPADRFQTPAEVAVALTPFTRDDVFPPGPPAPPPPPAPPSIASRSTAAGLSDGGRTRADTPAPVVELPPPPAPTRSISVGVLIGLAAVGLVSLGVLLAVAIGLLGPAEGHLVLHNFPAGGTVTVDGKEVMVERVGDEDRIKVPGRREFELVIRVRGEIYFQERLTLKKVKDNPVRVPARPPGFKAPPAEPRPAPKLVPDPGPPPGGGNGGGGGSGFFGNLGGPGVGAVIPPPPPKGVPPIRPDPPPPPKVVRGVMPEGFTPLFDGKDMDQWVRAPGWRVENGNLVGSDRVGPTHLFTKRSDFEDFDLWAEVKINDGGNSGLFFRAGPIQANKFPTGFEVQINVANLKDKERTGALFLNGAVVHRQPVSPVKFDEYFEVLISVRGTKVAVSINGSEIMTYENLQAPKRGAIALQMHNELTLVHFRKIAVKEARSPVHKVSPGGPGPAKGRALFNGKDLDGWVYAPGGLWVWQGATLSGKSIKGGRVTTDSFCFTKETFRDFELEFEVRRKHFDANTGLQFRSRRAGDKVFDLVGPQVEIASSNHIAATGAIILQQTGEKVADAIPGTVNKWSALELNRVKLRCVGSRVTLTVNGTVLVDRDIPSLPPDGVIGFQLPYSGTGSVEAVFGNVTIKEISGSK